MLTPPFDGITREEAAPELASSSSRSSMAGEVTSFMTVVDDSMNSGGEAMRRRVAVAVGGGEGEIVGESTTEAITPCSPLSTTCT
jgi:hypothetical protein